ncbi:Uncharacterised protein [Staphylococcus epidermidis]|uniref:hypothetical protein n=1 Tax=Staphylococcus epidermidis TaxID=1282 RepID=UPI000E023E26|nr:hypothetical protein [Staphylococcus epidermidis]SUM53541.1 Uncharacterised protein [Staphylococcus epidermidis]
MVQSSIGGFNKKIETEEDIPFVTRKKGKSEDDRQTQKIYISDKNILTEIIDDRRSRTYIGEISNAIEIYKMIHDHIGGDGEAKKQFIKDILNK